MGSRVENSIKNMFYGVGGRVLILVLNFVLRTIIIRKIGIGYLGIDGTLADTVSLLSLADLGFNTAVVYSFYEPLATGDWKTLAALIGFYKKIYRGIALGIASLGLMLLPFLRFVVKLKQPVPHLEVYYLLILADTVFSYLFVYKASILTADQKDYVRARISLVFSVIKIIVQCLGLLFFESYMLFLVFGLLSTIGSNYYMAKKATQDYPYIEEKVVLSKEKKGDIIQNIKSVFLYKISHAILNGTDNALISVLVGTVYVGFYSNYFLISRSIGMILLIVYNSTTASIGNMVVMEDEAMRYQIFRKMQVFNACLCGIVIPCYLNLIDDTVFLWLGKGFEIGRLSLLGIGLNFYINCLLFPIVSFREAVGLYRKTRYVLLGTAILNLILSVLLSIPLGMAGILLATPIARILTYVWYEPILLFRQYFSKNTKKYFVDVIQNTLLVGLNCFLCYEGTKFIKVESIVSWVGKGVICGLVSLGIIIVVYGKTEEFRWILRQGLSLLQRIRIYAKKD